MKKSILVMSLLSGTALGLPSITIASDISNTTHTSTLELKPASLEGSYKTSSVCFMGFGECDPNIGFGKGDDYSVDTIQQCLNEGFSKQNCNSVQIIDGACPYNPNYGRGCKCKPGLITCAAVQIGSGEACNGQYASCQCPTGVSAGAYGCAEYYTYPCGSACKRAYTACEVRTAVSAPYGCKQAWSDCSSKCQIAYTACEVRTAVSAPYGCKQAWGDCPSKCQVAYTACEVRTAVSAPYGCQQAWEDCSSKCQIAYPDNCYRQSAVSVPANGYCTGGYGDCGSKCAGWACNSGYIKSGSSCVLACVSGGSSSCSGQTSSCSSNQVQTSSCKDCSGTTHYSCRTKTCSEQGYYTACSGTGYVGAGASCEGLYKSCNCAAGYEWTSSSNGYTSCEKPIKRCGSSYRYYANTPCSNFSGVSCSQNYGPTYLGCTVSQVGTTGFCDPDAWRGCCQDCNGRF